MRRRHRIVSLLTALLMLAGCGDAHESYTRMHDAVLSQDERSIFMLVEAGDARLSGSAFSAIWHYEANKLAVWRLARGDGQVSRETVLTLPAGFKAYSGAPTLSEFAPELAAAGTPLPNCIAALTRCAIRRMPAPYLARDLQGDVDRGLKVIDPATGVLLRSGSDGLRVEAWNLKTGEALSAAAAERMRDTTQRVFTAAKALLQEALAKTGELPRERSSTYINSALSAGEEGLMAEYFVDAGGVIGAQLTYANEPPTKLRWSPSVERQADGMPVSFQCEADRPEATNWVAGCKFSARPETIDSELVYLVEKMAQLKADAAKDDRYQRARRGVTFGIRYASKEDAEVWLSCLGLPGTRVGQCDFERGDTECSTSLPLLCLKPDASAQASYPSPTMNERWLAARVAATAPVPGDSLQDHAAAHAQCANAFGDGWRLASFKDHGEGFVAKGELTAQRRVWIDSPDYPSANCWQR